MHRLLRRASREPLFIVGALWPLALLAPFVPGLPRPEPSGFPWRQEIVLALLLCLSLYGLFRCMGRKKRDGESLLVDRRELFSFAPLLLFTVWSALSIIWASNVYPVLHYAFVWGAYFLFFLVMRRVAASPRLLPVSLATFALVISIISLASIIGAWSAPVSLIRGYGLGEPFALAVPLLTSAALSLRRRGAALFCGATAVLAWLALIQAYERAPFIAVVAALLLLALLMLCVPKFRPRSAWRAGILIAAFVSVAALQSLPSLLPKLFATPSHTVISRLRSSSLTEENTQARFLFWGTAIEMWRAHPITGVGANHYATAFPEARSQFAASHPDSKLVEMLEGHLAVVAHNEYLQMLAELGTVGLALFLLFCLSLVWAAWRALSAASSPLIPGAVATLMVFAISSGASSVSFRWMGSGLIFFFAASIVLRFAAVGVRQEAQADRLEISFAPPLMRKATLCALVFSVLMFGALCVQAANVLLHGAAQESRDARSAESFYRSALFWNPYDGATHISFGTRLLYEKRYAEAIPHLRYGLEHGMNTSVCYASLAVAQAKTGQLEAAEQTLTQALKVYPRSVFLRARHAAALFALGKREAAEDELQRARAIYAPAARGWQELINSGKDAATMAARNDPQVTAPGFLVPSDAVFLILFENGERPPSVVFNRDGAFSVTAETR